jgi:hypothetical protein
MLHLFDLRCPRPKGPAGALSSSGSSSSSSGSSDGSGNGGGSGQQRVELLPRAEWALSPSPLVDFEQQDAFKGPGLRCVAAGRCDAAGGLDPYVYAGSGTGRAWVVDRRTGRVLFDWQAHGGGGDSGRSGSSGSGGVGGGSGDNLGGSRHGTSSSGGTGGGSGSGGVGSGGLGSAFHDARSLAAAVLAVRPGSARHSCVTVSLDQSALVWDLSGAAPRRVAAVQGLPSVSTAGVLGAHLHSATVHVHDFVTNAGPAGLGGSGGGGGEDAAAAPRHRQVIFAAAGHKMSVAALPLPGATDAAVQRYLYDRGGHKLQRHQLTTKACVMLPLWRMVLLGGLDDKIRVCI